jgi:hypothetical protein
MKAIVVLLLFCSLFSFCSKKDYSNTEKQEEEKQEVLGQETIDQETLIPETSYVFDIEAFRFLEDFPLSISEIKDMYPDENFEEKISTSEIKGLSDKNWYSLESQDIIFDCMGKTIDEAILYAVEIFTPKHQCNTMQIIGMPVNELENISGYKLDSDKRINISNSLYVLSIKTDGNTVKSYVILREL